MTTPGATANASRYDAKHLAGIESRAELEELIGELEEQDDDLSGELERSEAVLGTLQQELQTKTQEVEGAQGKLQTLQSQTAFTLSTRDLMNFSEECRRVVESYFDPEPAGQVEVEVTYGSVREGVVIGHTSHTL